MNKVALLTDLKNKIGPAVTVDDSGLTAWLNEAYMYMVDEIVKQNADYFTTSKLSDVNANEQEYSLPADYEKVLMVNIMYSGNWKRALPLPNINAIPVIQIPNSGQGFVVDDPRFYIYGGFIGFLPIPTTTASEGLKLWYVYTPTELVGDSDSPAIPAKYHHLITMGAYAIYLDQDDQHQAASTIQEKFEERVLGMVENLGENQVDQPKSIVITAGQDLYVDQGDL